MKRNQSTIHVVDTPFVDHDFYDIEDYPEVLPSDPFNSTGQRMVLILAIVVLLTFSLGFLALPATSQTSSQEQITAPLNASESDIIENEVQDSDVAVPVAIGDGRIAGFFTPEVHYWDSKISEWANVHGVDPNAVATIMQIESCGDPQAVSIAGARGLFQVMPFHFTDSEDMLDPDTNAMRGMNFFNEQLRYTGGDVFLSFAGYNGGYAASGGDYANWPNETQRYYEWARGIYQDANAGLGQSETLDAWLAAGGGAGCQRAAERLGLN